MMKKVVAAVMAFCLAAAPVSCFAEDETDYSYLEDMSVKELKALRDAINEILGDNGGSSEESIDIASMHPEWEELDATSDPYASAIALVKVIKESMYVPDSFQLRGILYYKKGGTDWFYVDYAGQNSFGGISGTATLFEIKGGAIQRTYQKDEKNFLNYYPEAYDIFWDMRKARIGEELDCQFIEYQVSLY